MKYIREITWEEVFDGLREREANNPSWIKVATEAKGWPDWESWRRFMASQIRAEEREWQIFAFDNPMAEIPQVLIGPFGGWQSRLPRKNQMNFVELLEIPEQAEHFRQHTGVTSILNGLPFATEMIGLVREDNKIVLLDGHHRATAISLAAKDGKQIDFSNTQITIALSHLKKDEVGLLDEILERGSAKNPAA